VSLSSYPSIASALAAERHSRLIAEADHRRRLAQLHPVWKLDTAAARFIRAVRVNVVTSAAWVELWIAATSPQSGSRRFVKGEGGERQQQEQADRHFIGAAD